MKNSLLIVFAFAAINLHAQCTGYTMNITTVNPTCHGFCDGSLTVVTTGGNGGETFTITDSTATAVNVGGSNAANNLCDGWYYVHVIDMMGCVLQDSVEIIEPEAMAIDFTLTNALCFGQASGSINIDTLYNPTGNPNFVSYFWSPNPNSISSSGDSTGLVPPGFYTVNVTDENGCAAVFDFDVLSPPELVFSEFGGDDCVGGNDGVVYMAATGGTPDYDYFWYDLSSTASQGSTTWGGLNAGCYEGVITDNNGCELKDTMCIGCLSVEDISIVKSIYPNPTSNFITIELTVQTPVSLVIRDLVGREMYTTEHFTTGTKVDLSELSSGQYIVEVSVDREILRTQIILE